MKQSSGLLLDSTLTISQLQNIMKLADAIIENFDEASLLELAGGSIKDVDKLLANIIGETDRVLHSQNKSQVISFDYLDKLSSSVDESLRKESFGYFLTNVLTNFEVNWHHLEWTSHVETFQNLGIICSRGLGKSFYFSNAYPLWKMYRYEKPKPLQQQRKSIALCEKGMLFTYETGLGEDLMTIIQDNIEMIDPLRERLFPNTKDSWNKRSIKCRNGARLQIKSYGSAARGRHPGYIIVDDFLVENVLYSAEVNQKIIAYFDSVIKNMIMKQGQIIVTGCVHPNSLILLDTGLKKIGDIAPTDDIKNKQLYDYKKKVLNKEGLFVETSNYWCNGLTKTKKITLQGGYQLESSLIHPLWNMGTTGVPDWVEAQNLKVGDYIGLLKKDQEYNGAQVDLRPIQDKCPRINLPDKMPIDLSYLIGLWVAEGWFTIKYGQLGISNIDKEICDFLETQPYGLKFVRSNKHQHVCYDKHGIFALLEYLGVTLPSECITKDIPKRILEADKATLRAFLQGLFDGDGTAGVSKKNNKLFVGLSSTSESLVKNTQKVLLMIFGIHSSIVQREPKQGKGNYTQYTLNMSGKAAINYLTRVGFRLSRKQNKIAASKYDTNKVDGERIPHQVQFIQAIRKACPPISHEERQSKTLPTFINKSYNNKQHLQKGHIKSVIDFYRKRGVVENCLRQIEKNISDDILWREIVSIEDSEEYTVDFHIPEGHNFITNGIVSHNTPFRTDDLYGILKKNKKFKLFEYPAIFPDGTILWDSKKSYEDLMNDKANQSNLSFSREVLCKPITNDSTIFPYEMLVKCFSETRTLIPNIYSSKIKYKRVVSGFDFAISSSIGADYSVYFTLGIDDNDYYDILDIQRHQGLSYGEQMIKLKKINLDFKPDVMFFEDNGFQKIFADEAKLAGLPVVASTTTTNKHDLKSGVPSLALLFENGRLRIPRGNQESIDKTDVLIGELSSITFTTQGLRSVSGHDDEVMALWKAIQASHYKSDFSFDFI